MATSTFIQVLDYRSSTIAQSVLDYCSVSTRLLLGQYSTIAWSVLDYRPVSTRLLLGQYSTIARSVLDYCLVSTRLSLGQYSAIARLKHPSTLSKTAIPSYYTYTINVPLEEKII